jgi:hypothetical protein
MIRVCCVKASSFAFASSAHTSPQSPFKWRLKRATAEVAVSVISCSAAGVATIWPGVNFGALDLAFINIPITIELTTRVCGSA